MKLLFKNLYEAFETKKQTFLDAALKPIATIDRYRGQPLDPTAFEYFELPAIFIGHSTAWTEEVGGTWTGTQTLEFHVVLETMGETGSQYTNHEEGLKYFDYISAIRKVLDPFRTSYTSKMKRSTDNEVDTGVVIYEILRYTLDYDDVDAAEEDRYTESENDDLDLRGGLVKHL